MAGVLSGGRGDCVEPQHKRLKLSSATSDQSLPKETITCNSTSSETSHQEFESSLYASSVLSHLHHENKLSIEVRNSMDRAKGNLRLCYDKIFTSKVQLTLAVKLEELLVDDTWLNALPGELQKPYAKSLCMFISKEICGNNGPIFPPQHMIFNALNSTTFDSVKVVILGQDPYHGPGQAMGLAFSVPVGVKIPSSLMNIFKELKQDLSCTIPSHGNLDKWAAQGVLLLNTVLTVRCNAANSHSKKGWECFTDEIIKTISIKKTGVVFLLWGKSAQLKLSLIDETKHHVLKASHPSGLSANRGFFGCRHFSRTNEFLKKLGLSDVDWQI